MSSGFESIVIGGSSDEDEESGSSEFSVEIGAQKDSDSSSEVDLESGVSSINLHLSEKVERECRICQLGKETTSQGLELQTLIQLGCYCKGDLGSAHKKCAETWFKIKGNMTCEICGATAVNVTGSQTAQSTSIAVSAAASNVSPGTQFILPPDQRFWTARRAMNFLLAGMIFAFVISWLFHFKILQ